MPEPIQPMPDPATILPKKRGKGLIIAIIVVIVLGLLAVAGTWYYMNKKINDQKAQQQQQIDALNKQIEELKSQSGAASSDETANWSTYKSKAEGFTIKYPSDWTLETVNNSPETVSIKGPNNFTLRYDVYAPNANTPSNCSSCKFSEANALNPPGLGKTVYQVVMSNTVNNQPFQQLGVSNWKTLQEQQYKMWPYYTAKNVPDSLIRWVGEYVKPAPGGGQLIYYSYNDFVAQSEVQTAKQILQTLTY